MREGRGLRISNTLSADGLRSCQSNLLVRSEVSVSRRASSPLTSLRLVVPTNLHLLSRSPGLKLNVFSQTASFFSQALGGATGVDTDCLLAVSPRPPSEPGSAVHESWSSGDQRCPSVSLAHPPRFHGLLSLPHLQKPPFFLFFKQ